MLSGGPEKRWTLIAVCVTTFMLLVDITIVNVALPSVQRELHASLTGLQWVVDAYAVSLAALILTAGALADRFGRRRTFALGIALFTVASFLCGIAWNIAALDRIGSDRRRVPGRCADDCDRGLGLDRRLRGRRRAAARRDHHRLAQLA